MTQAPEIRIGRSTTRIYNTRQAAEYCGLSYEWFRKYARRGDVEPIDRGTRPQVFAEAELDRFKRTPRRGVGKPPQPKPASAKPARRRKAAAQV